jgi:DNA-binding NarL/FixJ family response regulator
MIRTTIIDDHKLFSEGLSRILIDSGKFEVIDQIADSRMAFEHCLHFQPELVLMDYNMPHLNGYQLTEALKNLPYKPCIVVLSMYADSTEIDLFLKQGVQGYISKTTGAKVLLEDLQKAYNGQIVVSQEMSDEAFNNRLKPNTEHNFTKRELEILAQLKIGKTSVEIAELLFISLLTVETHRKNINQKLNFKSKAEFYDFLNKFNP